MHYITENHLIMTFLPFVSVMIYMHIYRWTDMGIWAQTGVAYPVQVNGLVSFTDTGTQTRVHIQV